MYRETIPQNTMLKGLQVEFLLKQIQFGVTCSEHAVTLIQGLATRLSQAHLLAMIAYMQSLVKTVATEVTTTFVAAAPTVEAVVAAVDPAAAPAVAAAVNTVESVAAEVTAGVPDPVVAVAAAPTVEAVAAAPVATAAPAAAV